MFLSEIPKRFASTLAKSPTVFIAESAAFCAASITTLTTLFEVNTISETMLGGDWAEKEGAVSRAFFCSDDCADDCEDREEDERSDEPEEEEAEETDEEVEGEREDVAGDWEGAGTFSFLEIS